MNSSIQSLIALTPLVVAPFAQANLIGSDPFNYPNGALVGSAGGAYFDWDNDNETHTGTVSDWDVVFGTPVVAGHVLVTDSAAAKREFNGPGEGLPQADEGVGALRGHGVLYIRFEMTRDASATWSGASSYDFGTERLFFGVTIGGSFGIDETGVGETGSDVTPDNGISYLLVGKVDFDNDLLSLYVDPDLRKPEDQSTPVVTRPYSGDNWSTAVRLGSGGRATWDRLAVATTWEDLTLGDPESASFVLDTRNIATPSAQGTVHTDNRAHVTADTVPGSLRQAIANAEPGATVDFAPALSGQSILLDEQLLIDQSMTIDGLSLAPGVTLDGQERGYRIMEIPGIGTPTVHLKGLTLRRGDAVGVFPQNAGGAVYNHAGSTLTIEACTLIDNSAGTGGAIRNAGTLTIDRSTLAGNLSVGDSGAVFTEGETTITHATIIDNAAASFAGGIWLATGGTLDLSHSVIAGNQFPDLSNTTDPITINGPSLFTDLADSGLTQGPNVLVAADPMLAALGYYGGPTWTCPPLPGSPAIDIGGMSPHTHDQRGFPRHIGSGSDLGAVEWGAPNTYSAWALEVLGDANASFGANPDCDPLPNAVEFVQGSAPTAYHSQGVLTQSIVGGKATYTLRRRLGLTGVSISLEVSSSWNAGFSPLASPPVITPVDAQTEDLTWTDDVALTPGAARYAKLVLDFGGGDAWTSETYGARALTLQPAQAGVHTGEHYLANPYVSARVFEGTVSAVGTNSLSPTCPPPADTFSAGEYFVLLTSGTHAGTTTNITATTETDFTLLDDLSGLTAVGERFEIRRHARFDSLFGPPSQSGLAAGANSSVADRVQLVGINRARTTHFYFDDGMTTPQWLDNNFDPAGATLIMPEQGFVVIRSASTASTLFLKGTVLSDTFKAPVEMGDNLMSAPLDQALTLDALALHTGDPVTGVRSALNAASADNLIVIHPNGSTTTYFYSTRPGFTGWRTVTLTDSGGVVIPAGGSFYIRRKTSPAFAWTFPSS